MCEMAQEETGTLAKRDEILKNPKFLHGEPEHVRMLAAYNLANQKEHEEEIIKKIKKENKNEAHNRK